MIFFNNELFTGHTIGYMYDNLCIKIYSFGLLSYYCLYYKEGYIEEDQGFDGNGDEIPTWGMTDPCEESESFQYIKYWDNGNIKEQGESWCGSNLGFKFEYYEDGKMQTVSYYHYPDDEEEGFIKIEIDENGYRIN